MTLTEKAVIEAFTGFVMCCGDETWARYVYAERLMGFPVYTHDFADSKFMATLQERAKDDFVKLAKGENLGFELEEGEK